LKELTALFVDSPTLWFGSSQQSTVGFAWRIVVHFGMEILLTNYIVWWSGFFVTLHSIAHLVADIFRNLEYLGCLLTLDSFVIIMHCICLNCTSCVVRQSFWLVPRM